MSVVFCKKNKFFRSLVVFFRTNELSDDVHVNVCDMNNRCFKITAFIRLFRHSIQIVSRNSEPTYQHATAVFCVVTDSFPDSSLASACYRGSFHVT